MESFMKYNKKLSNLLYLEVVQADKLFTIRMYRSWYDNGLVCLCVLDFSRNSFYGT